MNKVTLRIVFAVVGLAAAFSQSTWAQCNSLMLVSDTPNDIFEIVDQQLAVDKTTNLMWARCSMGYLWQDGNCVRSEEAAEQFTWQDALAGAKEVELAGYSDWRLPNRKELESIVERRCFEPAINEEVFPSTASGLFWSSSPNDGRADASWVIDFSSGAHRNLIKTEMGHARLVRTYK